MGLAGVWAAAAPLGVPSGKDGRHPSGADRDPLRPYPGRAPTPFLGSPARVCSLDGVPPSAASSQTASPVRTMVTKPEPAQLENVPIAVPLHIDAVGSVAVQLQKALQ